MKEMRQKTVAGLLCLACAGSAFSAQFTRLSDGNWSDLTKWKNNTLSQTPATNFPTSADQILLNANRVLTLDTDATVGSFVTPNAANTTSTLILTNSAAGYTLTATSVNIGINSQVNSQGYAYQSTGTVAATTLNVYGASGGSGTYNLMGGTVSGTTLNVGGVNTAAAVGTAAFKQSGGSVSSATVTIGGAGTQTYTMTGGTLAGTTLNVGSTAANATGSATMDHSAGTVSPATVNVGGTGTAIYNLGGSGVLSPASALNVGTTAGKAGTVNQSGGTVNAALNIGADGTYNLDGGNLNAAGAVLTVNKALKINGGTLTIDHGPANVTISGAGLLEMTDGTLSAIGTAADDVLTLGADMTISGGLLDLKGQIRLGGKKLTVVGDGATLSLERLGSNADSTLNLVFGETGISTIDVSGWMTLDNVVLTVDGSAYAGSATRFVLLDSANNTASLAGYSVTGFGTEGVDWELVQDIGLSGSADVVLNIIPEPAAMGLIGFVGIGFIMIRRWMK